MIFQVNHPILFGLAGLIIAFVLGQSLFFLIKAYRRALVVGFSKSKLHQVMIGSAVFSLAPALAILIGLLTLSKFLGLPLPWLRLSVLGALTYELPAAAATAKIMKIPLDQPVHSAEAYTAIAWVMTLGILSGILIILFFQKRMMTRLRTIKKKDSRWSTILMDSLFMGMIAAFLGMIFADIQKGLAGWIPVFVMLFSALLMILMGLLVKKCRIKWLENYAMPLSMVGGMAFAVIITRLIQG